MVKISLQYISEIRAKVEAGIILTREEQKIWDTIKQTSAIKTKQEKVRAAKNVMAQRQRLKM